MSLALALGWKYNNAPGICTADGILTAWPEALGPAPDQTEQAAIIEEYEARLSVPDQISDRQFFQQLAIEGKIAEHEALDAVGSGAIPAAMEVLILQLPSEQQFSARMLVRGATVFKRDHPVTALIGQLYGFSEQEIDALWVAAAQL